MGPCPGAGGSCSAKAPKSQGCDPRAASIASLLGMAESILWFHL